MDYYAILNLSPQANSEDIKRAFRRLARQFHPDVAGEGSRERFEQIYQAYQVLSNPEERRRYDAQRHSPPSSVRGERRVVVRTTGSGSISAEPPARESLEAGIARVKAAWRERKLPTAVALAEALLKRFPNSKEAIHILALAYQRFGNHLINLRGSLPAGRGLLEKSFGHRATQPRVGL